MGGEIFHTPSGDNQGILFEVWISVVSSELWTAAQHVAAALVRDELIICSFIIIS